MEVPDFCAREQLVRPHARTMARLRKRAINLRNRIGDNHRNLNQFGKLDASTNF
jgi:hypothetical protein